MNDTDNVNDNIDTGIDNIDTDTDSEALKTADKKGAVVTDNGAPVTKATEGDNKDKTPEDKEDKEPSDIEDELKEQKQAEVDAKKELADKGVDFDALTKEYEENGSLSEASMKALADAGYPKSVVDAYIRGMEATAERYVDAVMDIAGGKEAFTQMVEFIKGLGQEEINAYNSAIEEGNLSKLSVMFDGYKARMVSKYGTNNRSILGGSSSGSMGRGFANKNAMVKAMNDPKYDSDPEYRAKVQNMIMYSDFNKL